MKARWRNNLTTSSFSSIHLYLLFSYVVLPTAYCFLWEPPACCRLVLQTSARHHKNEKAHKKQLLYVWTLVYKPHMECFLGCVKYKIKTIWSRGLSASLAALRIKLDTCIRSCFHLYSGKYIDVKKIELLGELYNALALLWTMCTICRCSSTMYQPKF